MKIQLDLPEELNKKIAVYRIENSLNDKKVAIIKILEKFFKKK